MKSTPMPPAQQSHQNIGQGSSRVTWSIFSEFIAGLVAAISTAAAITHMNAVEAALVPAVWMTLFIQRFCPCVFGASASNISAPRKALTTLTLGPRPSLRTT